MITNQIAYELGGQSQSLARQALQHLGLITNEIAFPLGQSLGDNSLNLGIITNQIAYELGANGDLPSPPDIGAWKTVLIALTLGSGLLSGYLGYQRNGSGSEAIGWGILGLVFPIVTPAIALAMPPSS